MIVKEAFGVDPTHVGVLYVLDGCGRRRCQTAAAATAGHGGLDGRQLSLCASCSNKDGRYDLQEVLSFVDLASNHCRRAGRRWRRAAQPAASPEWWLQPAG